MCEEREIWKKETPKKNLKVCVDPQIFWKLHDETKGTWIDMHDQNLIELIYVIYLDVTSTPIVYIECMS